MRRVLIIDDEDLFREDLATLLRQAGYACTTAASGEAGLESAQKLPPDIVLCDLLLPGIDGLEVTSRLMEAYPTCAVLVISAHTTVDTAIGAFRKGALDVLVKPLVTEALLNRLRRVDEELRLRADLKALRLELSRSGPDGELVGRSSAVGAIRDLVRQIAAHDASLLITGESGTGKEVVARMVHAGSQRQGPFVAVNCATVTESLFDSELFGHAKGAFTGADRRRIGFFEAAQNGTLLLDEIGEIPLGLQGKLLRAVERHEIVRVGEVTPIPVDVRVIAATNRDVQRMVEESSFRTDLYYRLRVLHIAIPPLRQRTEDIPELCQHFLRHLAERMHLHCKQIEDQAISALVRYAWPGNVRELKNTIERALIVSAGNVLRLADLPAEVRGAASDSASADDLRAAMRRAERAHILQVLRLAGGNRGEAARRLGIDPSTLWRKIEDEN